MLQVEIPGQGKLVLEHLVLDYNGTLAADGVMDPCAEGLLCRLAQKLTIHVVTADTFGLAESNLSEMPLKFVKLTGTGQSLAKLEYLNTLGAERAVCVGNGQNDHLMLKAAKLGVAVVGPEGASAKSLAAADVIVSDIASALNLLLNPLRLTATLRD
jgi:soluble P-type ATPase